jgi:hypothetical protein
MQDNRVQVLSYQTNPSNLRMAETQKQLRVAFAILSIE